MIGKRELTTNDYLSILRRRIWIIVIPAVIAGVAAFAVSYAFSARYTAVAIMQVEEQQVAEGFVKPVVTEELAGRISNTQAQLLSRNRLQPIIERYGLQKTRFGQLPIEDVLEEMRKSISASPLETDFTSTQRKPGKAESLPGFYISYTGSDPAIAQKVCNDLASLFVDEDLKSRQQAAQGTTEFLADQVNAAKRNLDEQDSKLAAFKKRYLGQLPDETENNLKILAGLSSQLDASTQVLNRAQQDKAYAETLLAQSLAEWKTSQGTNDPKALQQQLTTLQSQLLTLQSRYTDEYPEVIKAKSDIAEVKRKLSELESASQHVDDKATKPQTLEPPEIQKLRAQVHQDEETIAGVTKQQARIQEQIRTYQSRVEFSPAVEEQYKKLTRDYADAQKFYSELLNKRSESAMTSDLESRQQGEQIRVLDPASFPEEPSFPNRLLFAGGGLGAGLALGLGMALLFELSDNAIRTELDVEACLQLPTLVSIPLVWAADNNSNGASRNGDKRSGKRGGQPSLAREEIREEIEI